MVESHLFAYLLLNYISFSVVVYTIPYKDWWGINCSTDEVLFLVKSLDSSKATNGPDRVSAQMLKATAHSIAPSLIKLFNISFRQGCFPECWKHLQSSQSLKVLLNLCIPCIIIIEKIIVNRELWHEEYYIPCMGVSSRYSTQSACTSSPTEPEKL